MTAAPPKFPLIRFLQISLAALILITTVVAVPYAIGGAALISWFGERATGYQFTVRGDDRITLWPRFSAIAEDISVNLPDDRFLPVETPPPARVARIEADIDVLALFTGILRIERLEITRPQFRLSRDGEGRRNWMVADAPRLASSPASRPRAQPDTGGGTVQSGRWRWIDVGRISVKGGSFKYSDTRLDRDFSVEDLQVEGALEHAVDGRVLRLRADGSSDRAPAYLEIEARQLDRLSRKNPSEFNIIFDSSLAFISSRGVVSWNDGIKLTADTELAIENVNALRAFAPGLPRGISGALNAVGDVIYDNRRIGAYGLDLKTARSQFKGSVELLREDGGPRWDVDLVAEKLDLADVVPVLVGAGLLPSFMDLDAADRAAAGPRAGGRARVSWKELISGLEPGLASAAETSPARATRLTGSGAASFSWHSGAPNLAMVVDKVSVFEGLLNGRAEITESEKKAAIAVGVSFTDVDASTLLSAGFGARGLDGALNGEAELLSVGGDLEELLSASIGKGQVDILNGRVYESRLAQGISKEQPFNFDQATIDFSLRSGLLKSTDVLFRGAKMTATGVLTADLANGQVDVELKMRDQGDVRDINVSGKADDLLLAEDRKAAR